MGSLGEISANETLYSDSKRLINMSGQDEFDRASGESMSSNLERADET